MLWIICYVATALSFFLVIGFAIMLVVCWVGDYTSDVVMTAPYPTDEEGEPIKVDWVRERSLGLPPLDKNLMSPRRLDFVEEKNKEIIGEMQRDLAEWKKKGFNPLANDEDSFIPIREDLEYFRLKLWGDLRVPKQFIDPLDFIDDDTADSLLVLEAGGPSGDKLVEDCWMREQLVISLDDAEDIVAIINDNGGYEATLDRDNRSIIVSRINRC